MDQIGKYEVLDKIGSGGFAVVYKGYDPIIKRPVAIKVCYSRDEETRKRFEREAEIAGKLVHRNITTVHDAGVHEQMPYLVEEYLTGEDLAHIIRRQEPETLAEKLELLIQIAGGLGYAHDQGVIHRDIKPSNIRVLDNGRIKIMDFGTAKLANVESNLTQTGMTLGTVAYLSPERLLGRPSGLNSDLFSFGVLAYEMLSFRRPFSGRNIPNLIDQVLNTPPKNLRQGWPDCPPKLAEIVDGCLRKDPAERYASCRELLADLEQVRAEYCAAALPPGGDSSAVVTGVPAQLSALLERARDLHGNGKHERAELLLDEVLELDPDNAVARQLLGACHRASAGTPLPAGTTVWEAPEDRQARKVNEGVASVESYLAAGELVQASEALALGRLLFQDAFEEAPALSARVVEQLGLRIGELREAGLKQARQLVRRMADLRQKNLLPLELAERFAELVSDLDPEDLAARHIVVAVRQAARQEEESRKADLRQRKMQEAVGSIEKYLAEGKPVLADEALKFAVGLFGELEQGPELQQRISEAMRQTES